MLLTGKRSFVSEHFRVLVVVISEFSFNLGLDNLNFLDRFKRDLTAITRLFEVKQSQSLNLLIWAFSGLAELRKLFLAF